MYAWLESVPIDVSDVYTSMISLGNEWTYALKLVIVFYGFILYIKSKLPCLKLSCLLTGTLKQDLNNQIV